MLFIKIFKLITKKKQNFPFKIIYLFHWNKIVILKLHFVRTQITLLFQWNKNVKVYSFYIFYPVENGKWNKSVTAPNF